jgi:hypothetical protein
MRKTLAEEIIKQLECGAQTVREIIGYELGGQAVLRCTAGFMAELVGEREPAAYYRGRYDQLIREFWQLDDYDFVTHHASRVLFSCWQEELATIKKSPFGQALSNHGVSLPAPTKPTRERRRAAARYWYDEVRAELRQGRLPVPRQTRNALLRTEDCRARDLEKTHGWFALLLSVNELWSAQVILMWRLVRESIRLNLVTRDLDDAAADNIVNQAYTELEQVSSDYRAQYHKWHAMHFDTVERHDPFFRKYLVGVEEWFTDHGAEALTWPITEPAKDELYLEIATGVAQLHGTPYGVTLPKFEYWRRAPWTAASMLPGAPHLPPFDPIAIDE